MPILSGFACAVAVSPAGAAITASITASAIIGSLRKVLSILESFREKLGLVSMKMFMKRGVEFGGFFQVRRVARIFDGDLLILAAVLRVLLQHGARLADHRLRR